LQDPRSNFATDKNKFLTSVPKVYAAGGEISHQCFFSTFPCNPISLSLLLLSMTSIRKTHAFRISGTRLPNYLGTLGRQFAGNQNTQTKLVFFADCHRGQSLIVTAISEGRQAARQIDLDLMGETSLAGPGGQVHRIKPVPKEIESVA